MALKKLYIFVEGNDDERFFRKIIVPLFRKKYDDVEVIQYAQTKKEKVDMLLQSIDLLKFDYLFAGDMDYAASVNQKKKIILNKYSDLRKSAIVIVIVEIESWYFAGLSDTIANKYAMRPMESTDTLTKEEFNQLYFRKFKSRIHFMHELLNNYSFEHAVTRNASFRYFLENFVR